MMAESQPVESRAVPRALLLIMIIAFFSRLIYWWFLVEPNPHLSGDAVFYYESARSIAYNLSYSYHGLPTALKPPVYPLFAGLILILFGSDMAVVLLQHMLGVMACLPIFMIIRYYLSEKKALLVTLAYLLYPTSWHWESLFVSESLYLCLNNLFLFFIHRYLLLRNNNDLALGSFWAAASFLTRPAAIFPLASVFFGLVRGKNIRNILQICTVWSIIFGVVLAPWVVRNYLVFGKFIPASTSGGVTLYTSYVSWGYDMSIVNFLPEDRAALSDLENGFAKDKYLLKKTFEYIKDHPLKIISLAPSKVKDYLHPFDGRWYPLSLGSKYNIFYGILMSLAALGYFWNRNKNFPIVKLAGLFIMGGIISVVLFHGEIRYRFVLNSLFFLLAGLCFYKDLQRKQKQHIVILLFLNFIVWSTGILL